MLQSSLGGEKTVYRAWIGHYLDQKPEFVAAVFQIEFLLRDRLAFPGLRSFGALNRLDCHPQPLPRVVWPFLGRWLRLIDSMFILCGVVKLFQ